MGPRGVRTKEVWIDNATALLCFQFTASDKPWMKRYENVTMPCVMQPAYFSARLVGFT
jgi:hypothetical protein